MPFISNTNKQRKAMLTKIGVSSYKDLLKGIPEELFIKDSLNLDNPLSELEIAKKITNLSEKNLNTEKMISFLGAGIYDHFIPSAVNYIVGRPEFYSAYTPYQAEVSQGTLQFIYEFQSLICELTGMDAANASLYDGATAIAESIFLALQYNKGKKVIISNLINPHYKEVVKTYTSPLDIDIIFLKEKNGRIDLDELERQMDDNVSAVIVQNPNFFGIIEEMNNIEKVIHSKKKTLFVAAVDPISLMVLKSPIEYKADIVLGEGQMLGNPQGFGGPLFGFFSTQKNLIRRMPGRISGATYHKKGNRGYVLTLQTREQHIRRDKATSNICTNESLCALAATIYMVLLGKKGLAEVAEQCIIKAHYLYDKICQINGFKQNIKAPFFKEFVIKLDYEPQILINSLLQRGYFAGLDLSPYGYKNHLMMAVTEKRSKQEIDEFIEILKEETNKIYL